MRGWDTETTKREWWARPLPGRSRRSSSWQTRASMAQRLRRPDVRRRSTARSSMSRGRRGRQGHRRAHRQLRFAEAEGNAPRHIRAARRHGRQRLRRRRRRSGAGTCSRTPATSSIATATRRISRSAAATTARCSGLVSTGAFRSPQVSAAVRARRHAASCAASSTTTTIPRSRAGSSSVCRGSTTTTSSAWAPVVQLGAGPASGAMFIPEVDDEVLVGFEHGDGQVDPYVIGGLYNGVDKPSLGDGPVRQRPRPSPRLRLAPGPPLIFFDDRRQVGHRHLLNERRQAARLTQRDRQ